MKSGSNLFQPISQLFGIVFMVFSGAQSVIAQYDIASNEYTKLSEKYLQHIANMEWEKSFKMLADDVVFNLPDGDIGTRTSFKGIDEVKAFWNSYVEKSGNDKATFSNFLHLPVAVTEDVEAIGMRGVFDICYLSAELSYGSETAKVRMNYVLHFDENKKIDLINSYYDRTPIIEAAKKNFLSKANINTEGLVVQSIKIKSELSEEELLNIAATRADRFRKIPGLVQKYYVRHSEPGYYGGIYLWDSVESMKAFMQTELAATMSQAYEIVGSPSVEISDVVYQLRD